MFDVATPCTGSNQTTYLRSEATRLMEFSTKVLKDVTLNACASACTNNQEIEGFAFFEEEAVCSAPYAFERYPQSVLVGHAMKVTSVDGLSECLSLCLKSEDFLCKSAMYYYETGECILNRESKYVYGHLFKPGIQDTLVDYFENNCADGNCSDRQTLHWVRTEEYAIDDAKDVVIESSDAQQCNSLCVENKIGDERFPCKAFAFSHVKQECHLTAESSYVGHRPKKNFGLAPLTNGEYFEKYCLDTNLQCLEASFEQVPNRKMVSSYRTLTALSPHQCLTECMKEGPRCASLTYFFLEDECQLSDTSQFSRPDQFVTTDFTDYFDKICDPADPKISSEPSSEDVEKTVETNKPNPEKKVVQGATNFEVPTTIQTPEGQEEEKEKDEIAAKEVHSEVAHDITAQVEGTVVDDAEDFEREANSVEQSEVPVKARLSTECRMSGITVAISFGAATTGSIYIKDHFSSCRQDFTNTTYAELNIPLPNSDESNPRCPGSEKEPSKWSFMIVVQRNEMKAPLVTTKDKVFEVSCDYSKILDSSTYRKTEDELKSEKIGMQILRNGVAVTTVPLGAEVTLKWTVLKRTESLGFFINECIAERVGGVSPEPEPLKIIYQGCPEEKVRNRLLKDPVIEEPDGFSTKMKVFRFDGSRRVRIKCSIDVCVQRCPPRD
ncbi:unnamed protein product [Caenorhabditis auriculariae]|uniref:Uncharacterized protein n=1 Tax=Caenorhabditis auriculariae TaxID=2777116 RepID=A0A8S1HEM6_9PELO|nr:unnamed protein product [Caenorhabditis auriculariae]